MTTISREEFEELVRHDAALLAALRACPDPKTAWETAERLAAERGAGPPGGLIGNTP